MNIFVLGLNHKTAPIEIREKFYLNEIQKELLLSELKSNPSVLGCFVISTCNRTEIYLHLLNNFIQINDILALLSTVKKIPIEHGLRKHFYLLKDKDSIRHLLRVITGIDSLVLGEKQILGQVKSSFEISKVKGMMSKNFNLLSNIAIRTGKKAQNETEISSGGSSVSWAAIALAERIFKSLKNKSLLIIGAGKMSELAVGQISSKEFKNLYIINRTKEHAQSIVNKYGGVSASFADIKEILTDIDLCICASDAPHYVLEKDVVQKVMSNRKGRPLLMIDISMPRNIDPKVSDIPETLLYKIDDLENVVEENMNRRKESVVQVEMIINQKLNEYLEKLAKIQYNGAMETINSIT